MQMRQSQRLHGSHFHCTGDSHRKRKQKLYTICEQREQHRQKLWAAKARSSRARKMLYDDYDAWEKLWREKRHTQRLCTKENHKRILKRILYILVQRTHSTLDSHLLDAQAPHHITQHPVFHYTYFFSHSSWPRSVVAANARCDLEIQHKLKRNSMRNGRVNFNDLYELHTMFCFSTAIAQALPFLQWFEVHTYILCAILLQTIWR